MKPNNLNNHVALITTIEGNNNKGEGGKYAKAVPLEDEAISCFSAWRKLGGEVADIPIYTICVNGNSVSNDTMKKLRGLKVKYIEFYYPETYSNVCGYWNVPLSGKWFEQNLTEEYLIHIDLDMTLISTPTLQDFFCGLYDAQIGTLENSTWTRDIDPEHKVNFETCFICSWRSSNFYTKWYNRLRIATMQFTKMGYDKREDFRWSEIEEYVVDGMYHENILNIKPVKDFQISQWYPVNKVEDISKVRFYHDHADTKMMAPTLLQYKERLKKECL